MSEKINLLVKEDSFEVILSPNSSFLQGIHRVFFINVIGLKELENGNGYFLQKTNLNLSDTIIELTDYFKDEGAEIDYDPESEKIANAFDEGKNNLDSARLLGKKIKKNPPTDIEIPNLKRELKKYQIPAVAHLVALGNSANFSVPGSGKTTITLAGYAIFKAKGEVNKLLVISPRAAFMAWEDEYESCFAVKANSLRISGPLSRRKKLYRDANDAELILISYQMATRDTNRLVSFLADYKVMLVLDESHHIKRIDGGKWVNAVLSISYLAKKRVILTGTPVPNSLDDLWSQMTFLWPNPKILGTSGEYKDKINSLALLAPLEIKNELNPFYWRIHKSDLKLKKPKLHRVEIKMKPYQQAIYDALAVRLLSELVKAPEERLMLRAWRRARTIRLLQTASNPALLNKRSEEFTIPPIDATGLAVSELIENYSYFETPSKIEAVTSLVKELVKKGEKVIIWTVFVNNIKALEHLLKDYQPRTLYGDVPKDASENESFNREKMIRDFKELPNYRILIANPSACAESVSLHRICHHAVYLDRTFNCAQYVQSLDRIHRIGLLPDEQIHYYIFQSKNSIDSVIDVRLHEKQKRMLELLDDDFALMDLEASYHDISDDLDEEADFNAIVNQLKSLYE